VLLAARPAAREVTDVAQAPRTAAEVSPPAVTPARSRSFVRRLFASPRAVVGAVIVVALLLVAALAPALAPFPPDRVLSNGLTPGGGPIPPEWHAPFFLGTDDLGRDELSRLLWGSQISLLVGTVSTLLALAAGLVVGVGSAYAGGWVDMLVMRVVDVIMALPLLLAVILLASLMQPSAWTVISAIAFFTWPYLARVARSQTLEVSQRPYVEAARALGSGHARIVWRHILPAVFPIALTYATLQVAGNILTAASLSFLGIGVPPPAPDWGSMAAEGLGFYQIAPWLVIFPGTAIAITTLGFNYLGDGLRQAIDPRRSGDRPARLGAAS
jgi:peptide/nickel transport system permease protein